MIPPVARRIIEFPMLSAWGELDAYLSSMLRVHRELRLVQINSDIDSHSFSSIRSRVGSAIKIHSPIRPLRSLNDAAKALHSPFRPFDH
jgi:hypothetical protein